MERRAIPLDFFRVLSESDQERTNVLTVISIHRNKHFMRVLIIKRAALISEVA